MATDLSKATEDIRTVLDYTYGQKDSHSGVAYIVAVGLRDLGYSQMEGAPLELVDLRISDLDLNPHVKHTLLRNGYERVRDLEDVTEATTESWPRFGVESKRELIRLLREAGFSVRMSDWPTFDVFA